MSKNVNKSKSVKTSKTELYKSNTYNDKMSKQQILDKIQEQYEALPYPHRNPLDELLYPGRYVNISPSGLMEMQHYVFGGKRDFKKPFKALIAGGGTGDALVSLGQRLADNQGPYEIVYLDLSAAAQKIAAERVKMRNIPNVSFVQGSLLDCKELGLGDFDYIDSCGVLHHLPDPVAGMKVLVDSLKPDGGLGIMLYGEIGRTGVYHMQEMIKLIASGRGTVHEKVGIVRSLLKQLPKTNLLQSNTKIAWRNANDEEIYDLFCHVSDRAFKVDDIVQMMDSLGMRVVTFAPPFLYEPLSYLQDPAIIEKISGFTDAQRWSLAELLTSNMHKHIFYAVKKDNNVAPLTVKDKHAIPLLIDSLLELTKSIVAGGPVPEMNLTIHGVNINLHLPLLTSYILPLLDNKRTIAEIYKEIRRNGRKVDLEMEQAFAEMANNLISLGLLHFSAHPLMIKSYTVV